MAINDTQMDVMDLFSNGFCPGQSALAGVHDPAMWPDRAYYLVM
jgi:hypothetical protein